MSSARPKSSVIKKNQRYQPYISRSPLSSASHTTTTRQAYTPPPPIGQTPSISERHSPIPPVNNIRQTFIDHAKKKYPNFEPRNDFDILAIGGNEYNGPEAGIYKWLDKEFATQVKALGNAENVLQAVGRIVNHQGVVTGRKPEHGSEAGVLIRSIPQSTYSIRLFPGSLNRQEYCMDFVRTSTGAAVNSPFKFELWSVPNPISLQPSTRMKSLERARGCIQKEILPGQEKFILRDGTSYVLKRPGGRSVHFKVPVRVNMRVERVPDVDYLDFPESITL